MRFLKYASWILLVPVDIVTGVLAILLAPFVVPFYDEKKGHLPKGFRWMETYDNPIDGDGGHIKRWEDIRKWGSVGVYAQRVAWLWRNKAYNFAYHILGRESISHTYWKGNKLVDSSSSDPKHHGFLVMWNESAWGVFGFVPWLRVHNIQFCLRVYIGWKLKSEVNNPDNKDRVMLAFHINPFRFYKVSK
ncbi:hypothetical protein GuL6_079 [Buttiauxella phage vB_ButM_GuL6]|nr:hypothetical protein GuL6_079 [Buttiauxella phage vB_ButM_GuL6]